jgi:hypothetical protein
MTLSPLKRKKRCLEPAKTYSPHHQMEVFLWKQNGYINELQRNNTTRKTQQKI